MGYTAARSYFRLCDEEKRMAVDGDWNLTMTTPLGERKDKNAADNSNFYRATHVEAFLPEVRD